MYNFLNKHGQSLAFGLGFVLILIYIIVAFPQAAALESTLGGSLSDTKPEFRGNTDFFYWGLKPAAWLTVIVIVAMLGFGIYHVATNFKSSLKGLLGFAAMIILFIVLYSTASGEATGSIAGAVEKFTSDGIEFTSGNLKFISAGISTAVVMIAAAAATFVYSEVSGFFK